MSDKRFGRTHEERMRIARTIAAGMSGQPEPHLADIPIDEAGSKHERCDASRRSTGWSRCLDARCDRCWP